MALPQRRVFAALHAARPPEASGRALQKKSRVAAERCEVAREAFREQLACIAPERLVFLDECGFALNLHRLYGWTIGGGRCEEAVPFNKGVNRSVVGAFSLPSAANSSGLWALWQKLGAWNSLLFEVFVQEAVLPRLPRGSVLVLDNARIHHGPTLQKSVEAAGCSLLYLPPYSPDLNPIELVWSWLKEKVRTWAPRTDEQREHDIRRAQRLLPPHVAKNWFQKCGIR